MRSSPIRNKPAAGRTLIELMVAIALGLLILAGVGALYLSASQSTRVAVAVSGSEETGALALAMIGAAVRRAGSAEVVGTGADYFRANLLYAGPGLRGCTGSAPTLSATDIASFGCAATASTGDAVAVWYQGDSVIGAAQQASTDCLGSGPVNTASNSAFAGRAAQVPLIRSVFYLSGNALLCDGGLGGNPQTLFTDIEDFKVFYAFDETAYDSGTYRVGAPSASALLTATGVSAKGATARGLSPWDFVSAVYVCVLVRTTDSGTTAGSAAGGASQYRRCPQTVAEAQGGAAMVDNPSDGRVRRAYAQTFTLRTRTVPTPGT